MPKPHKNAIDPYDPHHVDAALCFLYELRKHEGGVAGVNLAHTLGYYTPNSFGGFVSTANQVLREHVYDESTVYTKKRRQLRWHWTPGPYINEAVDILEALRP